MISSVDSISKCIHDAADTPDRFREWLNDNSGVTVGRQAIPTDCPIHNFLAAMCDASRIAVTGKGVEITVGDDFREITIGDWAERFVIDFDSILDPNLILASATGKQALRVLDRKDGWQSALKEETV